MTPLRWLGVGLGVALLAIALGRRRASRVDMLLVGALAVAVVVISATGWAGWVVDRFGFHRGGERQILGVVVFASAGLLLLYAVAVSRISRLSRDLDAVVEGVARDGLEAGARHRFDGRIAVLIPAYDEVANIGRVLEQIPARVCGRETAVLVIDDGSRDATGEAARAHGAEVLRHVVNRGQGAAMRTGYRLVSHADAVAVVAMDADGQHQPLEMERLLAPVLSGRVDLTNGSRTLPAANAERVDVARDAGIRFFNALISLITRTHVTDCSNGYRAMRPQILRELVLEQNQFHNSEFLIEAIKRGVPTMEVPVTVARRLSGRSKKPAVLRYGWGFANAIVRTWLR